MKVALLGVIMAAVIVTAAAFAMRSGQHTFTFPSRIPSNPASAAETSPVELAGEAGGHPEDWPQWRGTRRDGIAGSTGLLEEWPAEGPPLAWTASGFGTGMSSLAVVNEAIFTLGRRDGTVRLECRSTVDGGAIWSTDLGAGDDPNATPTVDGGDVFAVTREGRIVCARASGGDVVWTRDFVAEFSGSIPTWGYSESPLVEQGRVICSPGADDALIVALDRATGATLWTSPLPERMRGRGHEGAGYSSAVASDAAGVHHYVQMFGGGVIGVAAADGSTLWGYSRVANGVAVIPTPLVHGDYVFVSSGYGTGAALLRLTRTASGLEPEEVYFHPGNKTQNHHGGMVLVDGHVYMGHGHNQGLPLCLDFLTGTVKWGPERGPGSGSAAVAYADGRLYFRYENARMALIDADPAGYRLKSTFEIPSNLNKSWPHPVIARKRLYLRDQDVLLCFDLATTR